MRVSEELMWYDGDVRIFEDKPFTGTGFELYPDGQLKSEIPYVEGFAQGICQDWHPNGMLMEQWYANHGRAEGTVKSWHDNGKLHSVKELEYGVEMAYDEWDHEGRPIASRRIDEKSELFKYVLIMRSRAANS